MKTSEAPQQIKNPHIMVVDDDQEQLTALCNTLKDRGYNVAGFDNGKDSLNALRETPYDLLLADLAMPAMDGITLLAKALEMRSDLVGIIMTGEGTISTAVQALKVGALDYLLKPFKVSTLLPVISRALTVRQLRVDKANLENRLRKRTAELEAANEELKAFSYSIAHDLNAPLRALDGFATVLMEDHQAQLPPEAAFCIQKIGEGAKRMHLLVATILNFSALSWIPLTRTTVKPGQLVHTVIDELKPSLAGREVQFEIAELPECQADPALMRQVFTNLLSNAIKYSNGRSPAVIKVGWRHQESDTVYFVQDNGAGFDMRFANKLFRVFQRLHSSDQFEGNGVGLAIVQRIIQRHHGRVWATAEVDKGATFQFILGKDETDGEEAT